MSSLKITAGGVGSLFQTTPPPGGHGARGPLGGSPDVSEDCTAGNPIVAALKNITSTTVGGPWGETPSSVAGETGGDSACHPVRDPANGGLR